MTCLGHSLRSRAPSVHNKPILFSFLPVLYIHLGWNGHSNQRFSPRLHTHMSLLGWPLALCPDCKWNSSSEFLPDPPSLLLHLILCSWVMAPPATHSLTPLPSHCHNLDLAFHSFLQELLTHYLPTPISLTPNPFFTQWHGNNFSRRPI